MSDVSSDSCSTRTHRGRRQRHSSVRERPADTPTAESPNVAGGGVAVDDRPVPAAVMRAVGGLPWLAVAPMLHPEWCRAQVGAVIARRLSDDMATELRGATWSLSLSSLELPAAPAVALLPRRARRGDGRLHRSEQPSRRMTSTMTVPRPSRRPPTAYELGGTGIAVQVDHLDPSQVQRLAERLRADHGAIDVLVNDIWGRNSSRAARRMEHADLGARSRRGLRILRLGVDTHLDHLALPASPLIEKPGDYWSRSLTAPPSYNESHYRISVFYDLVEVPVNRLAFSQGYELAAAPSHGGRGHARMAAFGDDARQLRCHRGPGAMPLRPDRGDGQPTAPPGFALVRVPAFRGRCRRRPRRRRSPCSMEPTVGDLGPPRRRYGFTDIDGTGPTAGATYPARFATSTTRASAGDCGMGARVSLNAGGAHEKAKNYVKCHRHLDK